MTEKPHPPFSADPDEALRVFLEMAESDGASDSDSLYLLRTGFKAGAAWAFTVASKDATGRAEKMLHSMMGEQ